jgi:branched-chain amino acid transport system permease protein
MPGAAPVSIVRPPAGGRWVFLLVPLLVLPVPFLVNRYIQYVLNLILVYVLVGVGFNIVIGNLGQLAFANVALFGLGAYASGILVVHAGWPWWTTVVPAGLIGALAGVLASLPALRRIRLFYLAIMTMAFGELLRWIYIRAEPLTNGSMGLAVPPPMLLGLRLQSDRSKFYVFLALVVVVVLLTSSLLRSRFGRAFMAIRDNELAAAAMGIPTDRYFVLAFAWSGFVVGVAGAMYTALVGHVTPEAFSLLELILHFAIVMVGGLASLAGSVLIIGVLLFLPRGLVSLLARRWPAFHERYYRE